MGLRRRARHSRLSAALADRRRRSLTYIYMRDSVPYSKGEPTVSLDKGSQDSGIHRLTQVRPATIQD